MRGVKKSRARVLWLRRSLPILTLALLTSLFFIRNSEDIMWPEFEYFPDGQNILVKARFFYHGEEGQTLTASFSHAVQSLSEPDVIECTDPYVEWLQSTGISLQIKAKFGRYEVQVQRIFLQQDVHILRSDGTELQTAQAIIHTDTGFVEGHRPIVAKNTYGTLEAAGFQIYDFGKKILFLGTEDNAIHGKSL